jgi:archaellum component FlaG (FlaF/FlaG flagellin family)
MFQPGGTWKEFSLTPGPNHSYMPFWLFTIIWSFVSYLLASFIQRYTMSSMEDDFVQTQEQLETDFEQIAEPVSKSMGLNTTQNGFYVLNTTQTAKNRAPMYVYYGDKPPSGFTQQ